MSQCSFVFGFLGVRWHPFEMSGENTKTKSDGKCCPDGFVGKPQENGEPTVSGTGRHSLRARTQSRRARIKARRARTQSKRARIKARRARTQSKRARIKAKKPAINFSGRKGALHDRFENVH